MTLATKVGCAGQGRRLDAARLRVAVVFECPVWRAGLWILD
jgi:hypothetical protein